MLHQHNSLLLLVSPLRARSAASTHHGVVQLGGAKGPEQRCLGLSVQLINTYKASLLNLMT